MGIEKQPYPWLIEGNLWKPVSVIVQAADVSGVMFVAETGAYYRVREVNSSHSVASTSGTLQIEVLTPGDNADAGTDQLTGTIDLSATADTPQKGTMIATPTIITPGDMVGYVLGGTLTNLVNCNITVMLERIQPSLG